MNAPSQAAKAFHHELASALQSVPPYKGNISLAENENRVVALAAVKALIETKGGSVKERWDGTKIRLFGINASSATGMEGACRNWITQLTLKSMAVQNGGAA